MKQALIIYGSTTGNTEEMAGIIKASLEDAGFAVSMKDAAKAEPGDMVGGEDLLLLGCPAYGDDSVEMQDDFQEFFEKWDGISLIGKKIAVFAPGDSTYEHFCGTVDLLQERVAELGGSLVAEGLKVDGDPGTGRNDIAEWAADLATILGA